jgi:c-di-GMP-binding flagellar brake protein YcgR
MQRIAAECGEFPLNIWDKIEVIVGDGDEQGIYVSRVEDINGEGPVILKPDFVSGNKLLTANSIVYIQFLKPDALYRFSGRLRQLTGGANGLIQIHSIGAVERVQRRQFVRVDIRRELKYAHIKRPPGAVITENLSWHDSFTSNISAGGMLMKIEEEFRKGDILLIKVGRYEEMGIPRLIAAHICRIIRQDKVAYAGIEYILDRKLAKFFSPNEIDRLPSHVKKFTGNVQSRLVKYIFNQQIMERQKGLI